jgi:hypothetical protein
MWMNGINADLSPACYPVPSGVTSFNTRVGAITLQAGDVPWSILTGVPTIPLQNFFSTRFSQSGLDGQNIDLGVTGVAAGTYICPNLTVDIFGRVTAIANGTCSSNGSGGSGSSGPTQPNGGTVSFSSGAAVASCTGSSSQPCVTSTAAVSPSQATAVTGGLGITASNDQNLSAPSLGSGYGELQVSCDSGTTWQTLAICSKTSGGQTSCSLPTVSCSGVAHTNALKFQTLVNGTALLGSFSMSYTPSSSVTVQW